MTKARDKIKRIANDRISPYTGSYLPSKSEVVITENKYDTKYLLLFFYILLGLVLIIGNMRIQ